MNKVEALLRMIGAVKTAVSPARAAAQKSEIIFPERYANPNSTIKRTINTSPDFPVSTTRESGTVGRVYTPVQTRLTQLLKPFGERQERLDVERVKDINRADNLMTPLERKNRNILLGLGFGTGLTPSASLLALYLLGQDEEEQNR